MHLHRLIGNVHFGEANLAWVKSSLHDLAILEVVNGRAFPILGLRNYAPDRAFHRFVRSQRFISGFTSESDRV